jgi:hypothetical protein
LKSLCYLFSFVYLSLSDMFDQHRNEKIHAFFFRLSIFHQSFSTQQIVAS